MNIIVMVLAICPVIYTFSYAKYNWSKKNWAGATGALILAFAAVLLPLFLVISI
jgi:hydrogenase-4 membrane subunit HyfE